jgi:hypothetical protein
VLCVVNCMMGVFRKGRTALQGASSSQWREIRYTEGRKQSSLAICRQQGNMNSARTELGPKAGCGMRACRKKVCFSEVFTDAAICNGVVSSAEVESMDGRRDG